MLIQKIKEFFDKNDKTKILFFFDPDGEYLSEIEEWNNNTITLIKVDNNYFRLKYQLEYELKDRNIFLYFNKEIPAGIKRKEFPLIDIMYANKILRIDDAEELMQVYNIQSSNRYLIEKYLKYLKLKKNQKTLIKLITRPNFTEEELQKGIISCFLNSTNIDDDSLLIIKLLISVNNNEIGNIISKIKELDAEKVITGMLNNYFLLIDDRSSIDDIKLSKELFVNIILKLKYNLLAKNIAKVSEQDDYKRFKINNVKVINFMESLYITWQKDNKLLESLEDLFVEVGKDISEEKIISLYGLDGDFGIYYPTFVQHLLKKLINEIGKNKTYSLKILLSIKSKWEAQSEELDLFIQYLITIIELEEYLDDNNFIFNDPTEYIDLYTQKYYRADLLFRKLTKIFNQINYGDLANKIDISILNSKITTKYERFIKVINSEFLKCLKYHDYNYNNIRVEKQHDFYSKYVENSDQKIAVLISDGLRYEAGVELVEHLSKDPKNQVKLNCMVTSLPSNTKQGMTNLLPHNKIIYENELFYIDNISTEGVDNREEILKRYNLSSQAVQYEKLNQMDRDEARDLFKSKIVYIYHNVIDAVGDDRKTENGTYEAVNNAIGEINNIVKKIHSTFNVSKVIITADHGFLYNTKDLSEDMFESLPVNEAIVQHNRFTIVNKEIPTESYIFNLSKCSQIKTDYFITLPKAINRYKRQGHGSKYVHGGASLQEIIIPVIESNRKREEISERVPFQMINTEYKIISNAMKIKVFQLEKVGKDYTENVLLFGLYTDTDQLISNELTITLNASSSNPSQRLKEGVLTLSSQIQQSSICFLKVYDKIKDINKLNPLIKETVINQSLIQSEF